MNRFYPFFPFPPRQMQERYDLQNPQNNGIDPRYGGPPYGYGSYPPAPPPIQPQGLPDINDRYARYPGYQQDRPPLSPSPYPNSYPNQQHWRQPPPPSHHSFMDDLGSFASYFNPIRSAHAEEVPPAPTTSPPKPIIPADTSLGDRHRLTNLAVGKNENGGDYISWAGGNQGISFGLYQGDPSGSNPHADKAFREIVKTMREWRLMDRNDADYVLQFYDKKINKQSLYNEIKRITDPFMKVEEVKEITRRMDEAIGAENRKKVDRVNDASWKNRGHGLDPIEQAAVSIWGNKNDDLEGTAAAFSGQLKNASTEDVLRYLIGQYEYRPHPGEDEEMTQNRADRRTHHLDSVGSAVQQAIKEGVIKKEDVTQQSQDALNKVLKEVDRKKQTKPYNFTQ